MSFDEIYRSIAFKPVNNSLKKFRKLSPKKVADFKPKSIIRQYAQWNIEIAKELWKPEYQNFNEIIKNVLSKDKSLNLGEISSAEKKLVYYLIYKHN